MDDLLAWATVFISTVFDWSRLAEYREARQQGGSLATLTWTLPAGGQSVVLFSAVNAASAAAGNRKNSGESSAASAFSLEKRRPIRADDDSKSFCLQYESSLSPIWIFN